MSGTSLDGMDVVLVSISSNRIELIARYEHNIPQDLRQRVLAICTGQTTTLPEIGAIDHELGKLYADAVLQILKQANLAAQDIKAIGNHGQTVYHQPESQSAFTMQLGDPNIIAALTGIDTVADFRRLDMALGGQGAPLTPAFHQYAFKPSNPSKQRQSTLVVLNIGGIANITVLPTEKDVIGFDTGPGNLLMDAWCEKHTGNAFDNNAEWANQGVLDEHLLAQLLGDEFLTRQPPKSTGREHYNLDWLQIQLLAAFKSKPHPEKHISPVNVQRTLCEFTARSVALHIEKIQIGSSPELLICGGGVHNPLLFQRIQHLLPKWDVKPTDEQGIPANCMEAMAFAWLARQRIHNKPSNLPSVTGAKARVSLGTLVSAKAIN